jgi:peptidoglycan-associated lipoprotein
MAGSSCRRPAMPFWFGVVVLLWMVCLACGTKDKVAKTPPPPPPPTPVATISATPSTVQAGRSAVIKWETQNATDVRIEPLGTVEVSGSKEVAPAQSVTYHLIAKGPGGTQEMSARVTVVAASAASTMTNNEEQLFASVGRQDVFFDLDTFLIRSDQQETIQHDAEFLKQHPDLQIVIEGHCDELGSAEYNLALGESRAREVKSALVQAGVDSSRIDTMSYGKEHPFCADANEDCFKQNRRAHIVAKIEQPH